MNYEVWLMLLGYNVDFWEQRDVEKAIAEFGKLLVWEDPNFLSRIIVKARVVDLTTFHGLLSAQRVKILRGNPRLHNVKFCRPLFLVVDLLMKRFHQMGQMMSNQIFSNFLALVNLAQPSRACW